MSDRAPPIPCRDEVWRPVESFPAYSVSSFGRVRRDATVYGGYGSIRIPSGVLKARALPRGHLQVTLSMDNRPVTVLVHRLVAAAFLPPPMPGQDCVCHIDDNPANNSPSNLFWGTNSDNMADMVSKERQCRGAKVTGAKLTAEHVREIRHLASCGQTQRQIAIKFGISQSNVSLIVSRATWGHIL